VAERRDSEDVDEHQFVVPRKACTMSRRVHSFGRFATTPGKGLGCLRDA
jgi:hypothetical protein